MPSKGKHAREHICPIKSAASAASSAWRRGIFHSQQAGVKLAHKLSKRTLLAYPDLAGVMQHLILCRSTAPFLWWSDYNVKTR